MIKYEERNFRGHYEFGVKEYLVRDVKSLMDAVLMKVGEENG